MEEICFPQKFLHNSLRKCRRISAQALCSRRFPLAATGWRAAAFLKNRSKSELRLLFWRNSALFIKIALNAKKNTRFLTKSGVFVGCGRRTRTSGLRVMSPTSYQLLYPAIYCSGLVPVTGLEPVRYCYLEILSLLCLPFHHTGGLWHGL